MAGLMYGAGLCLMECLRLRVHDVDLAVGQIVVRDGKGFKDRVTMLPATVKAGLQEHLAKVKLTHERDLADGFGRVQMPYALARKYPNAPKEGVVGCVCVTSRECGANCSVWPGVYTRMP